MRIKSTCLRLICSSEGRPRFLWTCCRRTLCFVEICVMRTINGYCNKTSCLMQSAQFVVRLCSQCFHRQQYCVSASTMNAGVSVLQQSSLWFPPVFLICLLQNYFDTDKVKSYFVKVKITFRRPLEIYSLRRLSQIKSHVWLAGATRPRPHQPPLTNPHWLSGSYTPLILLFFLCHPGQSCRPFSRVITQNGECTEWLPVRYYVYGLEQQNRRLDEV